MSVAEDDPRAAASDSDLIEHLAHRQVWRTVVYDQLLRGCQERAAYGKGPIKRLSAVR